MSNDPVSQSSPANPIHAPIPESRPVDRDLWGEVVTDPHGWLQDLESDEVRAHFEAENEYAEAMLEPTEPLQEELFLEIKSRIKETDLSVPVVKDGWSYYGRTIEGESYGVHCRRRVDEAGVEGPEDVFFNENTEAGESEYFALGVFDVSPNHNMLAWGVDRSGNERFEVRFRDLETGHDLDDVIEDCSYGSAWALDNATCFYVRADEANRPHEVWRHVLGTPVGDDIRVFVEDDDRFFLGIGLERDEQYIHIAVSSAITDEVWLIPADDPGTEPALVEPRRQGIEYGLAHRGDEFLILTNDGAQNFRIMTAPDSAPGRENWTELVPNRDDVMLSGLDAFESHLVLVERAGGITRLSMAPWNEDGSLGALTVLAQPEEVSTTWGGANPDPAAATYRYGYGSMVTPASVFTVDLHTDERVVLKQQEVLGGYDADKYETWREWATAPDGTKVPMSLVARRDRDEILGGEPGPAMLYGYGSYEITMDPSFSSARLSLLDRGYVFALGHPRGGGALGRAWYEGGKFEVKANTFIDMVSCAHHLIDLGLTAPGRLGLRGGSAGGLMVGAVLNMAPELFGAAVAEVPFVDVINTMLDESLPLTVTEWEEWGNPAASKEIYDAMRTYAPLENVGARPYPPLLATAGISDPRVGAWEPAKWVAAIREHSTSDSPALLWTEMGAGHGGPSGRYAAWHDEARVLAFIISNLGEGVGDFAGA